MAAPSTLNFPEPLHRHPGKSMGAKDRRWDDISLFDGTGQPKVRKAQSEAVQEALDRGSRARQEAVIWVECLKIKPPRVRTQCPVSPREPIARAIIWKHEEQRLLYLDASTGEQ